MVGQIKLSLAAARVNANMTQKEAADHLNINRVTLNKWETGKVIPRTPYIMALSMLYNVPVDLLVIPKKTT